MSNGQLISKRKVNNMLNIIIRITDQVLAKFGLIRKQLIKDELDYGLSIAKQLDGFREFTHALEEESGILSKTWHVNTVSTIDDYLVKMYQLTWDSLPPADGFCVENHTYVRPRPAVLYPSNIKLITNQPLVQYGKASWSET